jgi:hypothetical protein
MGFGEDHCGSERAPVQTAAGDGRCAGWFSTPCRLWAGQG